MRAVGCRRSVLRRFGCFQMQSRLAATTPATAVAGAAPCCRTRPERHRHSRTSCHHAPARRMAADEDRGTECLVRLNVADDAHPQVAEIDRRSHSERPEIRRREHEMLAGYRFFEGGGVHQARVRIVVCCRDAAGSDRRAGNDRPERRESLEIGALDPEFSPNSEMICHLGLQACFDLDVLQIGFQGRPW